MNNLGQRKGKRWDDARWSALLADPRNIWADIAAGDHIRRVAVKLPSASNECCLMEH